MRKIESIVLLLFFFFFLVSAMDTESAKGMVASAIAAVVFFGIIAVVRGIKNKRRNN